MPPRRFVVWSDSELVALEEGVNKHGFGKWQKILYDPELGPRLGNHTNTELSNKWRSIIRERKKAMDQGSSYTPSSSRRRSRSHSSAFRTVFSAVADEPDDAEFDDEMLDDPAYTHYYDRRNAAITISEGVHVGIHRLKALLVDKLGYSEEQVRELLLQAKPTGTPPEAMYERDERGYAIADGALNQGDPEAMQRLRRALSDSMIQHFQVSANREHFASQIINQRVKGRPLYVPPVYVPPTPDYAAAPVVQVAAPQPDEKPAEGDAAVAAAAPSQPSGSASADAGAASEPAPAAVAVEQPGEQTNRDHKEGGGQQDSNEEQDAEMAPAGDSLPKLEPASADVDEAESEIRGDDAAANSDRNNSEAPPRQPSRKRRRTGAPSGLVVALRREEGKAGGALRYSHLRDCEFGQHMPAGGQRDIVYEGRQRKLKFTLDGAVGHSPPPKRAKKGGNTIRLSVPSSVIQQQNLSPKLTFKIKRGADGSASLSDAQ